MSYQIVFTDFNMPVLNGIDATRKMRNYMGEKLGIHREKQPIIIGVTGHVQSAFKEQGKEAGMD